MREIHVSIKHESCQLIIQIEDIEESKNDSTRMYRAKYIQGQALKTFANRGRRWDHL